MDNRLFTYASDSPANLTQIPGYGTDGDLPDIEVVGGEELLISQTPKDLEPEDLFEGVLALCASWSTLSKHDDSAVWLRDAVPLLEIECLIDFNNVVLTRADALADLADVLAEIWETISSDTGSRGNVALEGWTRLALAGWTDTLPVRAALGRRATQASRTQAEADSFLVRSLGAALDQWPDSESRKALERLATVEDVECDVAFELGMALLRQAVSIDDRTGAAEVFAAAHDMFDRANSEGERPDAVAFGTTSSAMSGFLGGQPVTEDIIHRVREAISEWHIGYLGMAPEWRQARAETAGAWATLLTDLGKLTELDQPWLDASHLLADIGRLYSAHNATLLVADPRSLPTLFGNTVPLPVFAGADPVTRPIGIPLAVVPRIDSALARTANTLALVDRWLEAMTDRVPESIDQAAVESINRARERIRSTHAKGKVHASREYLIPESIREALAEELDTDQLSLIEETLGPLLHPSDADLISDELKGLRPVPLAEDITLKELASKLATILPREFAIWGAYVTGLLRAIIRVLTIAIDREQGGKRNLPWHRDTEAGRALEADLADYLALSIQLATGNRCHVEVPNTGGGRADILIPIGSEQFVIEVKRITAKRTDKDLTANYGAQATEYTKTGAPFAFLAVLDLTPHSSRLDLADSIWVEEWHDDSGRKRALTGLRVLGNVKSPSAQTR